MSKLASQSVHKITCSKFQFIFGMKSFLRQQLRIQFADCDIGYKKYGEISPFVSNKKLANQISTAYQSGENTYLL